MPESARQVCDRCKGTGKLRYGIAGSAEKVALGGGAYMQDMGGSGTRACPCVRDLPAIEGEATWWESEHMWSRVVSIAVRDDRLEIDVNSEIPRDENGRRVVMKGNRYYPTMVDVQAPESMTLLAEDARDLALALLAAVAVAEGIDDPCRDVCGHWSPCDCRDPERGIPW